MSDDDARPDADDVRLDDVRLDADDSRLDDVRLDADDSRLDDVRLDADDSRLDDVRLRDVEEADLEAFLAYEHDPEAVRRSRFTPRPRDAFLTHWRTSILGDDTVLVQTVTVDGEPAGHLVAWWEGDRRFIGYWLGRPYWGRGIGTTALALLLDREKIRPLYADPFHGNKASVRLLERHGFHRTGTIRHGKDEHVLLVLGERGAP